MLYYKQALLLGVFFKTSTGILFLPGDFWFNVLVSALTISSAVILWVSGFGSPTCFCISVTSSLWKWFLKWRWIILCTSYGLITTLPLSLYMLGFSKGFWCSFLTALNILWSSLTLSSWYRIASICSSLILLTLFVMFFRILFFFRFSSIIFPMSVVFLISTRSCFCSSDIWCNWSSDFSLLQLGSLKPKLSFADSMIAFLMWGNVIDLFSFRADNFSVRVCWYNSFVSGLSSEKTWASLLAQRLNREGSSIYQQWL